MIGTRSHVGTRSTTPPKGKMPNVMVCSYNFPRPTSFSHVLTEEASVPEHLHDLIPHDYYSDPGLVTHLPDVLMPSMAILALDDLEDGEELFLNYRFNPDLPVESVPAWYHHVDEDEDWRIWSSERKWPWSKWSRK